MECLSVSEGGSWFAGDEGGPDERVARECRACLHKVQM